MFSLGVDGLGVSVLRLHRDKYMCEPSSFGLKDLMTKPCISQELRNTATGSAGQGCRQLRRMLRNEAVRLFFCTVLWRSMHFASTWGSTRSTHCTCKMVEIKFRGSWTVTVSNGQEADVQPRSPRTVLQGITDSYGSRRRKPTEDIVATAIEEREG